MLTRKTIKDDLDYLRQKSEYIDFDKDNVEEIINNLREFCLNNAVYALAPVQIGIPKRVIYLKNTTEDMTKNTTSYNEEIILINPVIIKMSGHTRFLERCASCLDKVGVVDRPYQVEVEYQNIKGEKIREIFTGFKATVFCHEYDHLEGILHIDIASIIMDMTLEETREYRANNPYLILSKEAEFKKKALI